MKKEYYHFEKQTQWPKFILDVIKDIAELKKQNGNIVTKQIYDKTLEVAVWMQNITHNENLNKQYE